MPRGDAARIRGYAVGLVDDARAAGETGITVRAGDVREALELDYRNAVINICQVLGTRIFQSEAGVELVARRGPSQGLNSVFEFRLLGGRALFRTPEAVSPVVEAPVDRPEGAGPSRRGPLSAVDRGVRRALRRVGTLLRRAVRTSPAPRTLGAWRFPLGDGPPRGRPSWPFPAAGPQPLDLLPSLLRHDGREGEGGRLCHRH